MIQTEDPHEHITEEESHAPQIPQAFHFLRIVHQAFLILLVTLTSYGTE
ncbi:hypothetical protein LINPERPRIM_LOCUS22329 [Linum perenne]